MKAVLHYRASTTFLSRLCEQTPGWLEIVSVDEADRDALHSELSNADVLLHVLSPVTAELLDAAPKLRLVQKVGVGINTVDIAAAEKRGVAVSNMPGSNSRAVAEHTLALMLGALRRIAYLDAQCRSGMGWHLSPETFDTTGELCGRTVGFVGYGAIPCRLSGALSSLGAKVIYHARNPVDDDIATWMPTLEALLQKADVVSLHLPLTQDTRGMLNATTIASMRSGSVLVNTARGELVDEEALLHALCSGQIAAAGLDVFAQEPARADNPLMHLPNVIATPHVGWLTPQTLERSIWVIIENCRRLRDGEPLLNQV
ncbi:hydroxyacid dehydrogenase [Burkholderia sp. Bp9140]|uniref:NAD(P)-dependent oxidoreductase n=1 Tax=Burkholderia sp. Bp9140 TaxID=2184572 RepID=UPI000F565B4F|nr:2-hydroxyacid dehydrogenase [Burkholderia sp. Bp9140]RQR51335.1 hydroxyacid dehydrogenase [Burkholderia sp. Bp9140]